MVGKAPKITSFYVLLIRETDTNGRADDIL